MTGAGASPHINLSVNIDHLRRDVELSDRQRSAMMLADAGSVWLGFGVGMSIATQFSVWAQASQFAVLSGPAN
jgi:hypothetical protein